jgi:hypothetical protein
VRYQQDQDLAFGQTSETSVEGNQTFRSESDTFVSSEPGGYVCMRTGNLTYSNEEKYFCYSYCSPNCLHFLSYR